MTNIIGDLSAKYDKHPIVQSLASLIPGGSAVDKLLKGRAAEIKSERSKEFFDELAKSDIVLTKELIESEDFLHAFSATTDCMLRTRRREKIRWLARLLVGLLAPAISVDKQMHFTHEYYLAILDEMTYEEIRLLVRLRVFDEQRPEGMPEAEWPSEIWDKFIAELEATESLTAEEAEAALTRLERTGTFLRVEGNWMCRPPGFTTRIFRDLVALCRFKEEVIL